MVVFIVHCFRDLLKHLITSDPEERYDSRDIQDYMFIHCTRISRVTEALEVRIIIYQDSLIIVTFILIDSNVISIFNTMFNVIFIIISGSALFPRILSTFEVATVYTTTVLLVKNCHSSSYESQLLCKLSHNNSDM